MIGAYERTQPGYRDNLDPAQQDALFELWTRFFRLCKRPATSTTSAESSNRSKRNTTPWAASMPASLEGSGEVSACPSQRGSEELTRTFSTPSYTMPGGEPAASSSRVASASNGSLRGTEPVPPRDDQVKAQVQGLQEAKGMKSFLEKYGGQKLRKCFWQMVKGEHPDAIMLRLLRARKWDVDRAVAALGSIAAWRVENNVEEIVRGGEEALTKTRGGWNVFNNGVSYIRGATSEGCPVYCIEVARHYSSNQTQEELQRAVILLQETLGSLMPPPVERKVVIFNLNGFGFRNMDWSTVFFMAKTMESFYVETLARIYVHGAPWIFKPMWTILKPLLDPVVRDKIRLTSDPRELEEYIPFDHLPKDSMRGGLDWGFQYPAPVPGENDLQKDTVARDALQEEYFSVCFDLEKATRAVAKCLAEANSLKTSRAKSNGRGYDRHHPPPHHTDDGSDDEFNDASSSIVGGTEWDEPAELASLKAKRDVLATQLRVSWLKLKPYMVGTCKTDRWGSLREDGTIVWEYPKFDGSVETQVLGEETSLSALQRNLEALSSLSQEDDERIEKNGSKTSNRQDRSRRISKEGSRVSMKRTSSGGSDALTADSLRRLNLSHAQDAERQRRKADRSSLSADSSGRPSSALSLSPLPPMALTPNHVSHDTDNKQQAETSSSTGTNREFPEVTTTTAAPTPLASGTATTSASNEAQASSDPRSAQPSSNPTGQQASTAPTASQSVDSPLAPTRSATKGDSRLTRSVDEGAVPVHPLDRARAAAAAASKTDSEA